MNEHDYAEYRFNSIEITKDKEHYVHLSRGPLLEETDTVNKVSVSSI